MTKIQVHALRPSHVPSEGERLQVYGNAWKSGRFFFYRNKNESPDEFIAKVVASHAKAEVCIAPIASNRLGDVGRDRI